MNERNIKNISNKGLYIAFAIKVIDKYENDNFMGRFFYIKNCMIGKKSQNSEYDYIDALTGIKYKNFYQQDINRYQNGEIRVMICNLININQEFISRYELAQLLNKYRIAYDEEKAKKVKVKKIVRKKN